MHLENNVGLLELKMIEKLSFITPNVDIETISQVCLYFYVRSKVSSA
jgi:hypothetical protein